jgi:Na+-translocating ferredoxin:NAD+ oxidoreductase subunit B
VDTEVSLSDRIDALLPQTQCTKCGYGGCRPYAEAIADGEAEINQCPPGGAAGIEQLARLLGRQPLPLNRANGTEQPLMVAVIDEARCIGCTLCIPACPVDAIMGSAKRMHSVIASHCTGCDLCLPPCPMDCISVVPVTPTRAWTAEDANAARQRHAAKMQRNRAPAPAPMTSTEEKSAVVAAALERARQRRAAIRS